MMTSTMTRNIDMPANLFSNLGSGNYSVVKQNNELAEDMKDYYESGDIKLTKSSNQTNYRERLNKMYDDLKGIEPVDTEVNEELDTKNYIEKGIVVKPTTQELKQFWTEYRLVSNENKSESTIEKKHHQEDTPIVEEKDDYDKIFESLSAKIEELNNYIKDLRALKKRLDKDKEQLEKDRKEFESYKEKEYKNIENEKNKISNNCSKLQTIINNLDETLTEVE